MSSKSISQLTPSAAQASDLLPVARDGNANYGVTAESIGNVGALKTVAVTLTPTQIKSLATPFTLVAGQPGHIYLPQAFTSFYKPGTKAYVDGAVWEAPLTLTSVDNAVVTRSATLTDIEFPAPPIDGMSTDGVPTSTEALITTPDAPDTGTYGLSDLVGLYATISGFSHSANNGKFFVLTPGPNIYTDATIQNINAVTESGASASVALGGSAIYHGTITGGAGNALAGKTFKVVGFQNDWNNSSTAWGGFVCLSSTDTTLELANFNATAETVSAAAYSGIDGQYGQYLRVACDTNAGFGSSYTSGRYTAAILGSNAARVGDWMSSMRPFVGGSSGSSFAVNPNGLTGASILAFLANQNAPYTPIDLEYGDGTLTVICQYYDFEV